MFGSIRKSADGLKDRVLDLPATLKATARAGLASGLVWEMNPRRLRAMAKTLLGSPANPSHLYRVLGETSPAKVALRWREESITFGQLDRRIDSVCAGLARHGVGRGASVLVMLRNRPEFVEVTAALGRMGAAAIAVSWRSTAPELAYLASHSGAQAIVFEQDLASVVHAAKADTRLLTFVSVGGDSPGAILFDELRDEPSRGAPPPRSSDGEPSYVVYTSGTSGRPKGAVRRFGGESLKAVFNIVASAPFRPSDVHLVACPMYHATAYGFLALTHVVGATAVLLEEFRAEAFLDAVQRHRATTTAVVPTMLHRLLLLGPDKLAEWDLRSLDAVFSCGAPLSALLATGFMDQFGDILYNFYGATETGLVTVATPEDLRAAPGTVGRPIPGNRIRLIGEDGALVPPGRVGELHVKNELLVSGYHNDERSTESSMKDGYFSVGDLARCDRDGRYFIEGRRRDMIISGGVNVYPAEVEDVLEEHADVIEAAVVGIEDPEWGERVKAYVVTKPAARVEPEELAVWARERLAGAKVPRQIVIVDALPRNPTGKVLKRELRARG